MPDVLAPGQASPESNPLASVLPVLSVVETTGAFVPLSWSIPAWMPLIHVATVAAGGAELVNVLRGLVGSAGSGLLDDLVEGGVDVLGHA